MKSLQEYIGDIQKYNLATIGLGILSVSITYANGCGAKGGKKFPSKMLGVNIESGCIGHDIRWKLAKSYAELLQANEIFDNDLKKITDAESNWFMKWVRRQLISYYVSGVELVGTKHYAKVRGFINE